MVRCLALAIALIVTCTSFSFRVSAQTATGNGQTAPTTANWKLTWSDEFDGRDGSLPDSSKWVLQTGGWGWGNQELEYYTGRPENAQIQNGNLAIIVRKEQYTATDGVTREYTSARMQTLGKFAQKYGRFEARMKLPTGQGIWPAFWMLGEDIESVGWPKCGEIDIMEAIGSKTQVYGTIHGPGNPAKYSTGDSFSLKSGSLDGEYHIFAIEWEPQEIRFYVDDTMYAKKTSADVPANGTWVFDHPYFLLLNVAVGGNWPGSPADTTVFPQSMLVDYVRVYEKK